MSDHLQAVNFDLIRYANCWEDADLLLQGLQAQPGGRMLSVASGGDNSFSLLCTDPEYVVAVDISTVQLMLVELKKVAIQHFDYETYLAFAGFTPSQERLALFDKIKKELASHTRDYWTHHAERIAKGVIYEGKFEHYFRLFAHRV
ncbi:MAG: DUF3419 family protein, partial [Bacteroidota bacterium]